jgi:hypothetical protein
MPQDLIEHEKVHLQQQFEYGDADAWWDKYLNDKTFRLEQELEATIVQVKEIWRLPMKVMKKPEKRKYIQWIAKQLSGPMYGFMITYNEALAYLLKHGTDTN